MKFKQAIERLAKCFDCEERVFEKLPKQSVIDWAMSLGPKYQLENWQHNFLIGLPY